MQNYTEKSRKNFGSLMLMIVLWIQYLTIFQNVHKSKYLCRFVPRSIFDCAHRQMDISVVLKEIKIRKAGKRPLPALFESYNTRFVGVLNPRWAI